jgi:integrase
MFPICPLDEARRGTLLGMVRTGATFADAAAEYVHYVGEDRGRKASTVEDYLDPPSSPAAAFGEMRIEDVTARDVDAFASALVGRVFNGQPSTPRTRVKILNLLHGLFARAKKVWGLPFNPAADVERPPQGYSGDIEVYSPEEVHALIRAAAGELSVPKSGKVRSVPMVDDVARLLAQLNARQDFAGDDDLVFCEPDGGWLNDDRLRRRYEAALKRAGLRRLRFHDLRHTFGSLAITRADIVEVQGWMGHADIQTTMRYLHYRDRGQAAQLGVLTERREAASTKRSRRRRQQDCRSRRNPAAAWWSGWASARSERSRFSADSVHNRVARTDTSRASRRPNGAPRVAVVAGILGASVARGERAERPCSAWASRAAAVGGLARIGGAKRSSHTRAERRGRDLASVRDDGSARGNR